MGDVNIKSHDIEMSQLIKTFGRSNISKLRKYFKDNYDLNNFMDLSNYTIINGIDIGKRKETQEKRTYGFLAGIYNKDIMRERIKNQLEYKAKQKEKRVEKVKKLKLKIKTNTTIINYTDDMLLLFYNKLKELYKEGVNVNVYKKGGFGGKWGLDFSFTFTSNFSQDYKNIYGTYIQIDSDTDRLTHDSGYKLYINVGKEISGKKILQAFKLGVTNCLFKPMIEWCDEKEESAKTIKTAYKYSGMRKKLIKDEALYRESGVSEEDINIISNKYQINIEVNTPFQKTFINCKSDKKALTTFKFINTRVDHVEHNKIVNLKPEIVSQEEINQIKTSLRGNYHTYTKNSGGVNSISTADATYKKENEYNNYIRDFEEEHGINNYYLDDMVDVEVSQFVRQGVHFNETIDFKDIENAKNNEKKYNHIDMKKAYSNFKMCKYYKGFVGKITDYRKTNEIVDVGYYRIENIRFKNANIRLKQYNEVMKIYNENVYPSPELEFLMANGVEFDIIEGCWGSSFNFEFDEHMLNTKDNDIKYYCKYVGNMFYYSEYNSFFMNCNEKLADHITYSSEYDMVSFNQEEQEVKVSYKKQHNNHLSHVCGFITSYMRMNVMEQLLSIEFNDVIRVCVDGIYLYGDYKTLNCFRDKPELIKQNEASESYISNDVCEIAKCKNGIRSHHLKELHKGVGGSGKTHLNIYDDGLIRKLFVAPSWKLSRSKNIECGIKNQVWANLISDDPEKTNYINQNFNVLIIDEVSMMTDEIKLKIFMLYPCMKIIMCGDPKYQLPSFEKGKTPFKCEGFGKIIKYTINRRCKCPELQEILTFCRDNIEVEGLYHIVKPMIKQRIGSELMKEMYQKEDLILCRSNKKKDIYTEMFNDVEKFYILKTDRKYCKGEIVFDKPDDKYILDTDYEIRHGFTTHSIQGETAKNNLYIDDAYMEATAIYTALSRAEYLKNIYIVEYSDNDEGDNHFEEEEEFDIDELYAMVY